MSESCGSYVESCACAHRKNKHYFVHCPFCDPRDNKVDLYEVCDKCYWNQGIVATTKDLIQQAVSCHYGHLIEFVVDVFEE